MIGATPTIASSPIFVQNIYIETVITLNVKGRMIFALA